MPVKLESDPGLADERAVLFSGGWTYRGDIIELAPIEDRRIRVSMLREDVEFRNGSPYVRVGAQAQAIDIPEDSPVAAVKGDATHSDCSEHRTCCVGGTEYCCDTRKVVGDCKGFWSC